MVDYIEFNRLIDELQKKNIHSEIIIEIRNNKYMIIPIGNKLTFQKLNGDVKISEIYFNNFEELSNAMVFDNMILFNEWKNIDNIIFNESFELKTDSWAEIKSIYIK